MVDKCIRAELIGEKEKTLNSNWRITKFLWIPHAAHYDGIAVVTLPIGAVKSVVAYDLNSKKIKTLAFRPHTGPEKPVGDAWADSKQDGSWYHKNYPKGILVKVAYKDKSVRTFKLTCPQNRSDGA